MFTEFDVVVCVIVLTTTIVALVRGAIRELLSIVSWGGAALSTLYFYPYALTFTEEHFASSVVGSVSAVVIVFVVSLILCTSIAAIINASFGLARGGGIDRSLGAILGFIKGFIIVSAIHFVMFIAAKDKEDPQWLQAGQTYSFTKIGADIYQARLKEFILETQRDIEDIKMILDGESEGMEGVKEFIEENDDEIDSVIKELENRLE